MLWRREDMRRTRGKEGQLLTVHANNVNKGGLSTNNIKCDINSNYLPVFFHERQCRKWNKKTFLTTSSLLKIYGIFWSSKTWFKLYTSYPTSKRRGLVHNLLISRIVKKCVNYAGAWRRAARKFRSMDKLLTMAIPVLRLAHCCSPISGG